MKISVHWKWTKPNLACFLISKGQGEIMETSQGLGGERPQKTVAVSCLCWRVVWILHRKTAYQCRPRSPYRLWVSGESDLQAPAQIFQLEEITMFSNITIIIIIIVWHVLCETCPGIHAASHHHYLSKILMILVKSLLHS